MKRPIAQTFAFVFAVLILSVVPKVYPADTLDVLAIMVEFKEDALDDQTSGNGTFNSVETFDLDPKSSRENFESHLEFARRYFAKVSSGKQVVRYAVADSTLKLKKQMRHYRVPSKRPQDTNNDYIKELNLGVMAFANDALREASLAKMLNINYTATTKRWRPGETVKVQKNKTIILFFHAGASGLIDGGGRGQLYADSPADLIDSYIWPEDMKYYNGEIYNDRTGVTPAAPLIFDLDTAVAERRGIYSADSSNFVDKILMCSETATQDSTPWGINGILTNQIARAMGFPDLWNTSTGTTAVGSFCLMDVGGYNTVAGFIPLGLSAWCREYKKWSTVLTPPDTVTSSWTFTLPSINIGDTIAKIPLSSTEYILLENRQWARHSDPLYKVTVDTSITINPDTVVFSYHTDTLYRPVYANGYNPPGPYPGSWASLIAESLCVDTPKCETRKKNDNKLKGTVVSASGYDIGLPGNGVLMWHINDRVIKENLQYNFVNGERDYRGVDLKEADGIEDIGADYVDPIFGYKVDAYGDLDDFYPHMYTDSNRYIYALTPFSGTDSFKANPNSNAHRYENTSTKDGGYTGVTIRIDTIQPETKVHEYYNGWGKKVRTYTADRYRVRVDWIQRQGSFPQFSPSGDTFRSMAVIPADSHIVAISDSSIITRMRLRADTVNVVDSSINRAGYRLFPVPPSVYDSSLYLAARKTGIDSLVLLRYHPASKSHTVIAKLPKDTLSVPLIVAGKDSVVAGLKSGILLRTLGSSSSDTIMFGASIRAIAGSKNGLAVVAGNRVFMVGYGNLSRSTPQTLSLADSGNIGLAIGEFYANHAGPELVVNDREGNVWMLDSQLYVIPGWPIKVAASSAVSPSIGDIDGDGFLDIVIPGNNYIHVLSRTGTPLTGWPYKIGWSTDAGQAVAAISLSDVDGDG
ncbi:MAG: hypothetical protein JNL74_19800, partial [Fibrobacteres bacterium]|nr:hypothetical protein [Fibrobacterota bacterium]